jgi:4-carboxymuconolactone decarboxylase
MPDRLKELAMCIGARSMDCQFIWNAHSAAGRRVGLNDGIIDAVRDRQPLPDGPKDEVVMATYGLELTSTNRASQETFQAALDVVGVQQLTEFTTLIGYYRMLSLNANGFTIDLPETRTEPLLPI